MFPVNEHGAEVLLVLERGRRKYHPRAHQKLPGTEASGPKKMGIPEDRITYHPYRHILHFINKGWEEIGRKEEKRRNEEGEVRRREAEKERQREEEERRREERAKGEKQREKKWRKIDEWKQLRGNTTVNAKKNTFLQAFFFYGRKGNTIIMIWEVIIYIIK